MERLERFVRDLAKVERAHVDLLLLAEATCGLREQETVTHAVIPHLVHDGSRSTQTLGEVGFHSRESRLANQRCKSREAPSKLLLGRDQTRDGKISQLDERNRLLPVRDPPPRHVTHVNRSCSIRRSSVIGPRLPTMKTAARTVMSPSERRHSAFETDAEARLVDALRKNGALTRSLVAVLEGALVGHIAFSLVTVAG